MTNIINIYKPIGVTSNDVVQFIKRKLNLNKVGHAGTLDPMAMGVMVIGVNNGTKKLSELILNDKEYIAEITLGKSTTTYDSTGDVTNTCELFNVTKTDIEEYINYLIKNGYEQFPPLYSAIKINGKKLYDYARKNEEIVISKRKVKILDYKILDFDGKILKIRIRVSKGFYIRSFANDIGEHFKCYAFLSSLIRTASGDFKIENSIKMSDIMSLSKKIIKIDSINEKINIENLVIGHFDLIHKSHLKLLNRENISILTFLNNPSKSNDFYNFNERINNILEFSPKNIFFLDINNKNYSKEEFINILKNKLNIKKIIVGSDFKFGKNRDGSINDLKKEFNIEIVERDELSTSSIKNEIEKGNIKFVNEKLFKNIFISGIVCHGKKLGRKIGFPTINVFYETSVNLKQGSYITKSLVLGKEYNSITFIKKFSENTYLIETFIDDYNGDLYGKEVKISICDFIRDPIKVSSLEELKSIIQNDLNYIKK